MTVSVATRPFAEGSLRSAYKVFIQQQGGLETECVLKMGKQPMDASIYFADVSMQKYVFTIYDPINFLV